MLSVRVGSKRALSSSGGEIVITLNDPLLLTGFKLLSKTSSAWRAKAGGPSRHMCALTNSSTGAEVAATTSIPKLLPPSRTSAPCLPCETENCTETEIGESLISSRLLLFGFWGFPEDVGAELMLQSKHLTLWNRVAIFPLSYSGPRNPKNSGQFGLVAIKQFEHSAFVHTPNDKPTYRKVSNLLFIWLSKLSK